MKFNISLVTSSLILGLTLSMIGCSSGGGGDKTTGGSSGVGIVATSYTSVAGITGSSSTLLAGGGLFSSLLAENTDVEDGTATLIVDSNANGVFDDEDLRYSTPVVNESFSFDEVVVSDTADTKAQLVVARDGYAPYVKTLSLKKDNPFSILVEIGNKPILTIVEKLPVDAAARATSFLKFGVMQDSSGITAFSKLMSLSEFKAEADLNLSKDGVLSESVIPTGAFPSSVASVTADIQAFDSTKPEDFEYFPGAMTGHGKPAIGATATDSTAEESLESAGFDMIKLTDQDGKHIDLGTVSTSKLSSMGVLDSCTSMKWTRYITSAQAGVITNWGDDDGNAVNGFQVPIWSNDNSTGSWEYIGLADAHDLNSTRPYFEMCVDQKWQGYLNCDSVISVTEPKQVCIEARDQNGNLIGGVSVNARKGISGNYAYAYLGTYGTNNGKGIMGLTTGDANEWTFTYRGALSGWSDVAVELNATASTTAGCDYDMNITIDNPYSAEIRVKAYAMDDTTNQTPLTSARVSLSTKGYKDYYNQSAYTDANGEALFSVKPNVEYTATYKAGESKVNVNGAVIAPETADSGVYASVAVRDENVAPDVYMYTFLNRLTDQAEKLGFSVSANDKNSDTLTLSTLKLNGTTLVKDSDYTVTKSSSYSGSIYLAGELNLNSATLKAITPTALTAGSYTFSAEVTDGKTPTVKSTSFEVHANQAPIVSSIYLIDSSGKYYYENSTIPAGDYIVSAYAYDRDGDAITKTVAVDDVDVTDSTVSLTNGDHNITATATESKTTSPQSGSRTVQIFVGNHAPVINSSGATRYRVDINAAETFRLYAYVTDAEKDALTVQATDANGTKYDLSRPAYGSKYSSAPIALTTVKKANVFTIVANDSEDNSTASTVTVESYATNKVPVFTEELSSVNVNVNTSKDFMCEAYDPEGTYVTYAWELNGVTQSETGMTFSHTFSATGSSNISCTATDADDKSSTSSATVLVVDPTKSGTLTVHTGYQGLKVSRHDLATYALLEEKVTDASGNASFSVTGDRTTFSITAWPGMEMSAAIVMEMTKPYLEYQAYYSCEYNSSIATECANADWCAISKTSTIANWIWDITRSISDDRPLASVVDTSGDGYISEAELHAAILTLDDKNSDGKLSWSELNNEDKDIQMELYSNVPVRDYYIPFSPMSNNNHYKAITRSEQMYYGLCYEDQSFDFNVTITGFEANSSKYVQASGSGYSNVYYPKSDANGTMKITAYVYNAGLDDKYTFLFRWRDTYSSAWDYYLLKSKTKAELEAGVTLSADAFVMADKNVTIHNTSTDRIGYIYPTSNGLSVNAYDTSVIIDSNTTKVAFFRDPSFTYSLYGEGSTTNIDGVYVWNQHYGYYTSSTLNDSYNAVDYPSLDVNVAFDAKGNWQLSGSEISKVNLVEFSYSKSVYDANRSQSSNLNINFVWTIAPSAMPDINISNMTSSDIAADIKAIEDASGYTYLGLYANDFKGFSDETSFIDAVTGVNPQDSEEFGSRTIGFDKYYSGSYNIAPSANLESLKSKKAPLFRIGYDTDKLFAK